MLLDIALDIFKDLFLTFCKHSGRLGKSGDLQSSVFVRYNIIVSYQAYESMWKT